MTIKPYVFIGSSSEGKNIAEALFQNLNDVCEPEIWDQGMFGLSGGTLETLIISLDKFDFAILVLTGDDLTNSRNAKYESPRDNVIFELGLFMGGLGRQRVFVVHDKSKTLKIPSDLKGFTTATFELPKKRSLQSALADPAIKIKNKINEQGMRANVEKSTNTYDNDLKSITDYLQLIGKNMITLDGIRLRINPKFSDEYISKIIDANPGRIKWATLKGSKPGIKIVTPKKLLWKDSFENIINWYLNYWNENGKNKSKTNRVEDSKMIFEALPDEVENPKGYFGSCIDIVNGIVEGRKYEIQSKVCAEKNTTMSFQLWVHDLKPETTNSVTQPITERTPSLEISTVMVRFIASDSRAMRIHLHCKAGSGKIMVSEVKVYEIKD